MHSSIRTSLHVLRCLRASAGFSLVELLIALAIAVMLGAIALPIAISSLDERAFESAGDSLQEQLLLARAHAQQSGHSVQVIFEPARGEIVVSLFDLESLAAGGKGRADSDPQPQPHRQDAASMPRAAVGDIEFFDDLITIRDGEPPSPENRIVEPWAIRPLGGDIRLQQPAPSSTDDDVAAGASDAEAQSHQHTTSSFQLSGPSLPRDRRALPLIVAVYLPDGTPLVADPLWLVDEGGRRARLAINAWSGEPVIVRHADIRSMDDSNEDDSSEEAIDSPGIQRAADRVSGAGAEHLSKSSRAPATPIDESNVGAEKQQ